MTIYNEDTTYTPASVLVETEEELSMIRSFIEAVHGRAYPVNNVGAPVVVYLGTAHHSLSLGGISVMVGFDTEAVFTRSDISCKDFFKNNIQVKGNTEGAVIESNDNTPPFSLEGLQTKLSSLECSLNMFYEGGEEDLSENMSCTVSCNDVDYTFSSQEELDKVLSLVEELQKFERK
jgi:hypothetical protein